MSAESGMVNSQNHVFGSAKAGTIAMDSGDRVAVSNLEVSMIPCPVCGLLNPPGSSACLGCATEWALTEITAHFDKQTTEPRLGEIPMGTLLTPRQSGIVLEIDSVRLTVPMADVITMGRGQSRVDGRPGPDVDLSLYGAVLQGVSRIHVKLTHDDLLVHVTDLNSTNGTWLNGQKILPYARRILRTGDELQLGKLKLKVLVDQNVLPE